MAWKIGKQGNPFAQPKAKPAKKKPATRRTPRKPKSA